MATQTDNKNNPVLPPPSRYLIVRPQNGGIRDLFRFLVSADQANAAKFIQTSDEVAAELYVGGGLAADHRWVIFVSIVVRKLIAMFGKPTEWIGCLIDFFLNLLSHNGGLLGLLFNLLCVNS